MLSLIMILGMFTFMPAPVSAAETMHYVERSWNADTKQVVEETKTCTDYTDLSESSSDELNSGWYAASGSLFIDSRLFVRNGKTVNLILKDGATLNVRRGIGVESGATLNIYGQSQGTGKLEVVFDPGDDRNNDNAVIGGTGEGGSAGSISIHGGVLSLNTNSPRGAGIGVSEPRHIIMKADSKVCMTEYSLTTGNDNASWKGRNWKDYTIYGANFASDSEAVRDSAQWQVVKAVENDSITQDVNLTRYDYPLDTPAAPYQYYKIEIMSNKGGSSIQMSEFGMKAVAPQEITLSGEGNTRTFTMPVYPVTVNAVFLPYLAGCSLSLNGDIGVNYFLNLTDRDITDGAKLAFAWTVNGKEKTHSVTLSSADKTSNGYKASCPIAVAEMTHEITATLTIGETAVATYTYSAVTYADKILNDNTFRTNYIAENGKTKYDQLVTLVKAMLDYGAKAQTKFNTNTDNLANAGLKNADGTEYVTDSSISSASITSTHSDMENGLDEYGLAYEGTSLLYLSRTTLRHYYTITDTNKTAESVIAEIEAANSGWTGGTKGSYIYFEMPNIGADDLATAHTLTINGKTYSFSALDYSKGVLEIYEAHKGFTYNDAELARATYLYAEAAKTYINGGAQ